MPNRSMPQPAVVLPLASSIKAAGIKIMGAPTTGRKDRKVAITPQNIGSRTPKMKNEILTSAPCTMAIQPCPKTFE